MALTNYEIASGWSQATRSNVEDLIHDAVQRPFSFTLASMPAADGTIARVTEDQATHWNGIVIVQWVFSLIPYAGFERLITTALGDMTTDSGQTSIRTRNDQNGYGTYNCYTAKPQPGSDYTVRFRNGTSYIVDLRLTHRIVVSF